MIDKDEVLSFQVLTAAGIKSDKIIGQLHVAEFKKEFKFERNLKVLN